jgi:hypothetical protein
MVVCFRAVDGSVGAWVSAGMGGGVEEYTMGAGPGALIVRSKCRVERSRRPCLASGGGTGLGGSASMVCEKWSQAVRAGGRREPYSELVKKAIQSYGLKESSPEWRLGWGGRVSGGRNGGRADPI